jgi:glucose/arabinose dehydrogenase
MIRVSQTVNNVGEDVMRVLLGASALAVWLGLLPAAGQQPSAGKSRKARQFPADRNRRDGPHSSDRREGRGDQEVARQDQAAARLQDRLYAIVPDARHIAVGPQGIVTFVGTRKSKVWSVTDRDKDRVADEVKEFAPSIDFKISERRVLLQGRLPVHRRAETACLFSRPPSSSTRGRTSRRSRWVKQGELIPPGEESYNHTARTCRIGPDDKLYITLGQPFNVFAPEKMDLYKRPASAASCA